MHLGPHRCKCCATAAGLPPLSWEIPQPKARHLPKPLSSSLPSPPPTFIMTCFTRCHLFVTWYREWCPTFASCSHDKGMSVSIQSCGVTYQSQDTGCTHERSSLQCMSCRDHLTSRRQSMGEKQSSWTKTNVYFSPVHQKTVQHIRHWNALVLWHFWEIAKFIWNVGKFRLMESDYRSMAVVIKSNQWHICIVAWPC